MLNDDVFPYTVSVSHSSEKTVTHAVAAVYMNFTVGVYIAIR